MKPAIRIPRLSLPYIYNSCLLCAVPSHKFATHRTFSRARTPNPPPPPPAGYANLSSRRLIALTGPDSTHYLQGVITSNVPSSPSPNARTTGFYAAFLNAQGRLLNDVFIYPYTDPGKEAGRGEGWLIEVDAKEVTVLAKHIKRYKLRAKFEVRVLEVGERGVWSVWEDGRGREGWTAHSLGGGAGDEGKDGGSRGVIGCPDKRAPGMGRRLLLPGTQKPDVEMEETSEDVYRVRRYLKGVAEGQDELVREQALPQESNVDFMGGIDYKKGCYVGQELTIRTHHRGVVRKRILPVVLYGMEDAEPTALEYDNGKLLGVEGIPRETGIGRFEKRGRSAGKFLCGVGNVGLGLCRLETMTDVLVQGEAGGYKEGDEFKVEWEQDGEGRALKIKAFVPPWHLKQ
ncbi:related to Putative transferase CAF17, mitochondrial [Rhynchosporium secalis]|uniref:Iron-sulfur cluster assembly factor IBA57 homolog, mitochondrial n=1 Tax=Rhynchosporium secalis TaxID=38038 RepID=A0A1E1LW50_RHYSE|nr:related to Putative transferase CAF17, mitochondrial [Rhynchosporium secalis]